MRILFSSDSEECLPMIHFISRALRSTEVCVYKCLCVCLDVLLATSVLNKIAFTNWIFPGNISIFTKDCSTELSVINTTRSEHSPVGVN